MSLEPVVVGDTDGNSSLASLSSRPVLRVIESNRTLVSMYINICLSSLLVHIKGTVFRYCVSE